MDPRVTISSHIIQCMEESVQWSSMELPRMIKSLERAWVAGLSGIPGFRYIAKCVCVILRLDAKMQNMDFVPELGTWLYLHNDKFWSPRNSNEVWDHLQYIYDNYVKNRHIGLLMWRQGTSERCRINILDWEDWQRSSRSQCRISHTTQSNLIDQVIEDFEREDKVTAEEVNQVNQMVDEVMEELEVLPHNTPHAMRELDVFHASLPVDVQTMVEFIRRNDISLRAAIKMLNLHTKEPTNDDDQIQKAAINKLYNFLDRYIDE